MKRDFRYIIAGGGLAGVSAIKGIREHDGKGAILLIGAERHMPYDRPPLTKKLWFGKKKVEDIVLNPDGYYGKNNAELRLGKKIVSINPAEKTVADSEGVVFGYEKLLLATGGEPRRLETEGANLEGVSYYRTLDDYNSIKAKAVEGAKAVIIGGGFIGSEMAASLNMNRVAVTMVFPSPYICHRVFPEPLGRAIQDAFMKRGIKIVTGAPTAFAKKGEGFLTRTLDGSEIGSDILIVGAGITPSVELAQKAGLKTDNGIEVDGFLRTSDPEIYAAGDNANFPYKALGKRTRVEHWDNAMIQGETAGANMAGAMREYAHMPYFFSDLFEFGYEAVGEVDSSLEAAYDWQDEFSKGVVYYLRDGKVRGVMLCNVWDKVPAARELIKSGKEFTHEGLKGAIR